MTELSLLQNRIKRDPAGYHDEFVLQLRHFESQLKIFQLKPSKELDSFDELVTFLSHIASCYKSEMLQFPLQISQLLENHAFIMKPVIRKNLVKSVILLRNRGFIEPLTLLSLLFKLFRVPDKLLRTMLYSHIVHDLRNINIKHKNNRVNSSLQNFMFNMLQDTSEIAAKKSHEVMIELYKRNIWNDTKTVNAIASGIFSNNTKICVATCKFFLGGSEEEVEESDEEDTSSSKDIKIKFRAGIHRKSKKRSKQMQLAFDKLKKKDMKRKDNFNFAAIELVNDPQGYAERIFKKIRGSTDRFEVRLMMMNFVSRLIGYHKLMIENFYPFLNNFLTAKQENITYILAIAAQSCHELIPPDVLEPTIKTIANNFVSDRSSSEVVAIGLNSIREICMRTPLAMDEALMGDLAQYKNNKDKGIVMAARSLINFYREKNPLLLHKKDRGRDYDPNVKVFAYGESNTSDSVAGSELLENMTNEMDSDDDEMEDVEVGDDEEELSGDEEMESGDEENEEEEEMEDARKNMKRKKTDDPQDGEEVENEEDEEDGTARKKRKVQDNPTTEDVENSQTEKVPKKLTYAATRILTDEDFATIRRLKEEEDKKNPRRKEAEDSDDEIADLIDPTSLNSKKHQKMNKEERMQSIKDGRTDRDFKNRSQRFKENKKGGQTNDEKERHKPFMLVKHKTSIKEKVRRSLKEKQQTKLKHAKHLKNQKKYKH